MTAKQFREWQAEMGWNGEETARRLGKSRDTVSNYRRRGVPERDRIVIALACKALAQGIRP